MKTRKPLADLLPEVVAHVAKWKPHLEFNFRLYKLLEGQIRKEIEDSLAKELISRSAFMRAIQRIPSINILKQTTDKLSKVYIEPPRRVAKNTTDIELLEKFEKESNVDIVMDAANKLYNSMFSFALEPYIENGEHKVRVLSPHQFLVYSDNLTDKSKPTVFIKFLGSRLEKTVSPRSSKDGTRQDTEERPELVDIMAMYTDDEFMIVDSNGGQRFDIMEEMGYTTTRNEFGRIPFVYGKKTQMELMPYPNQPGFDFSILIPKLLTDLNYAAQFCSHSMTWVKNVDLAGAEFNPDAIINLGDTDPDGASPEIGTITPTVNVQDQLSLIEFQFMAHLESLGIKAQTQGTLSNGRDASGLAKAIDEADISAEKKTQTSYFKTVEAELWSLIADMQNIWTKRAGVKERRTFSVNFKDEFRIEFSEVKLMKSFKQKIEEVQLLRDQKLISRRQSVKMLYPEWTDLEIDAWLKELDEESKELMEKQQEIITSMGGFGTAERKADGTFNEDNQAGGNQTVESKRPEEQ